MGLMQNQIPVRLPQLPRNQPDMSGLFPLINGCAPSGATLVRHCSTMLNRKSADVLVFTAEQIPFLVTDTHSSVPGMPGQGPQRTHTENVFSSTLPSYRMRSSSAAR